MTQNPKKKISSGQRDSIEKAMLSALKSWDVDIIKGCVVAGASVQELLYKAIVKQNAELVGLAIERGADLKAPVQVADKSWQTVLHLAHESFHQDVVRKILAAGIPVDAKGASKETVAQRAAREGQLARLQFYIQEGAAAGNLAQEMLLSATGKKDAAGVRWALENGADVHVVVRPTAGADTLLHVCNKNFSPEVATLLLQNGLSVDSRNADGDTVLHHAARDGLFVQADLYIKHGADPLLTNLAGQTPLLEAMRGVERAAEQHTFEKLRAAKSLALLLLERTKEVYGPEPFSIATQQEITLPKPLVFKEKPRP